MSGNSFGHPWERFCRLWGTLGPQFRQEGKLTISGVIHMLIRGCFTRNWFSSWTLRFNAYVNRGLPLLLSPSLAAIALLLGLLRTCQSLGVFVDFIYLIFIYRTYVMYISIMVVMYMPIMGRFPRNWFPSWTLRFNTHVDFWVPFWSPGGSFGGSFGHPWEPFCRLWGTLGPQFRQEGKLT